MKLLLTSHGSGPYGAERMLLNLAHGLATRGYQVVLDFPHQGPAVDRARDLNGVEVTVTGRRRLPRNVAEGFMHVLGIPGAVASVARLTRAARPDVVWVNSLYNPWAALGARLAGARVVWHLHERNLRRPFGFLAALLMGLAAHRIVAVSSYLAREYGKYPWLRSRLRTIPNPLLDEVAPARLSEGREGRPFTVGYVGQLEPQKRALDLVHAIRHLPDVRAVFVGDGKQRPELERAVRRAGVDDRVAVLGFRPDARHQLARFDCLAIPSLNEGFGLTALEAMAAGVPVIAANSGALPEVLHDAALYFTPRMSRELSERIALLQGDPELRRDLGAKGVRRARRFGSGDWLDAIITILNDLGEQGRHDQ